MVDFRCRLVPCEPAADWCGPSAGVLATFASRWHCVQRAWVQALKPRFDEFCGRRGSTSSDGTNVMANVTE
jgi:hypothetical protein